MKYRPSGAGGIIKKKDYSKRIIFTREDFEEEGHLLQVVTIPPKTKQRSHFHKVQTEVFYILEGEALIYINDKEYLAKPSDAFICSPRDRHNLWNKSEKEFKLAVFKINLPKEVDIEWEEE